MRQGISYEAFKNCQQAGYKRLKAGKADANNKRSTFQSDQQVTKIIGGSINCDNDRGMFEECSV